MTNLVQESLQTFIIEEEGDARLFDYVDAVDKPIELQDNGLETVRIQKDVAGNVVVATTIKGPNLRFRLGDLLLEATGTGMTIAGSLAHPLRLVLTGIRFLRAVRKLATLDIHEQDAEMLIAIYRLAQEEDVVHVDDLQMVLAVDWDDLKIARSLERLERLACIELGMAGVVLNETIIVQQVE